MSTLQWSMLALAVIAVVAIYLTSRRKGDSKPAPRVAPQAGDAKRPKEQMDLWKADEKGFDELGVGEPRPVGAPRRAPAPAEAAQPAEAPAPKPTPKPAPPAPRKPEPARPPEKLITFFIAEREGTHIFGRQIHAALQAQQLEYGDKKIYYRRVDGKRQYTVASMLEPGLLDRDAAEDFSTPGLAVILLLPGPESPLRAYDDMLQTAHALANALNAALYDARRQPMSEDTAARLRAEVADWARQHAGA